MTHSRETEKHEEEFKKKLEEMTNFPARIRISLLKEHGTEKLTILTSTLDGYLAKKKINNIKFMECQAMLFTGHTATLHIGDFETAESVIEKVNALNAIWGGKVVKEVAA